MSEPATTTHSTVCIAGGGPGGMVLGYLLARRGIRTTILESHADFDRAFRGDTLHSTTMELMDRLGLAGRVEAILQSKLRHLAMVTPTQRLVVADFARLRSKYPFVGLVPQARFLELLADEGRRLGAAFDLRLQATAHALVETNGTVAGLRYRAPDGVHEVRAALVVGADGRGSKVRALAGIELGRTSPPMDVLWFELPAGAGDDRLDALSLRFGSGCFAVCIHRGDRWQVGYVILKGSAKEVRAVGLERLRAELRALVPAFSDRVATLADWQQTQVLAVQTGRAARWHRPGLLLIGDAAHVMSPVGGVGINYAIQDAVAAANLLAEPLRAGTLTEAHLAAVQRRREGPTRLMQGLQAMIQRRVIAQALRSERPFRIPWLLFAMRRVPILRDLPATLFGRGTRVEQLQRAD